MTASTKDNALLLYHILSYFTRCTIVVWTRRRFEVLTVVRERRHLFRWKRQIVCDAMNNDGGGVGGGGGGGGDGGGGEGSLLQAVWKQ